MKTRVSFLLVLLVACVLRLYNLGNNPPSLYWDEVSLGYNAYSILKTGHDEHGNFFPIATFPAFGDYKPPLYIYATVPWIALFGLTEFAVRFTSSLSGIIAIYLIYQLGTLVKSRKLGLTAASLLALSPWHLQMSRGAFESNLATTLILAGVIGWIKAMQGKPWWVLLTAVSFALSMYTFNAQRLMIPLFIIVLALIYWRKIARQVLPFASFALIFVLMVLPMVPHVLSKEGQLRYREVNVFSDVDLITKNAFRAELDHAWIWPNLLHNRRLEYAYQFLDHYLDQFNFDFLFIAGDVNPRLSAQVVGGMYAIELVFVAIGMYMLFRKRVYMRWLILAWLLIAPIPAGTARETPHALRALAMLPPLVLISAIGLLSVGSMMRQHRLAIFGILGVLGFSALFYLHYYHAHYPIEYAGEWQYGYKQAVALAQQYPDKKIVMTTHYGRPYIYYLFYTQYDPSRYVQYHYQKYKDQYGVYWVTGFDRYQFLKSNFSKETQDSDTLTIMEPGVLPVGGDIMVIRNLLGQPVFEAAIR